MDEAKKDGATSKKTSLDPPNNGSGKGNSGGGTSRNKQTLPPKRGTVIKRVLGMESDSSGN